MSFQACLDTIEDKTGKTRPSCWKRRPPGGYGPSTKAAEVVEWSKQDYGLGRGHAMAFFHVVKNGTTIGDKHVGSTGTHRDESTELRLDGKANR